MANEYYKIFTSTVDTINANGGGTGLYPTVFKRYLVTMKNTGVEKVGQLLAKLTSRDLNDVEETATKAVKEAATEEYLVCLFLLLADDNVFGLLKTDLENF